MESFLGSISVSGRWRVKGLTADCIKVTKVLQEIGYSGAEATQHATLPPRPYKAARMRENMAQGGMFPCVNARRIC
jgi:hypothetical protein